MNFDIENSIGLKLSTTLNLLRKTFNRKIKKFNISSEQYAVLNLVDKKEVTPSDISVLFNKDKAAITRFINALEKKELIKKKHINRRSYKILITGKGKKLLKEINKVAAELREKIEKNISKEEMENCFKILEKIKKSIKE